MTVGKYILRSIKYFVKLVVLFAALFAFMRWSETSSLAGEGGLGAFFESYFATWRGWLFTAVIVLWCALYPRVEFVSHRLSFDLRTNKLAVIRAMGAGRMALAHETDGTGGVTKMVFRGEGVGRRLWWVGEDAVTITDDGAGGMEIEGPRRFVMEARQRIPAYIESAQ